MNTDIAKSVAQGTNELANKVLDKVDNATQMSRGYVGQGAQATERLLESGINKINKAQEATSLHYDKCVSSLSRCMTEKPVHSALVIAGVGAALALYLSHCNKTKYRNDIE